MSFFEQLDARETQRRADFIADRPSNLHNYQGCENDRIRNERDDFLVALQAIADLDECACDHPKCLSCIARNALKSAGLS